MEAFSNDLKETVLEEVKKKPTLAICVGMQMLLESVSYTHLTLPTIYSV